MFQRQAVRPSTCLAGNGVWVLLFGFRIRTSWVRHRDALMHQAGAAAATWTSLLNVKIIFVLTSAILEGAGFAREYTITKPTFRTSETCHVAAL